MKDSVTLLYYSQGRFVMALLPVIRSRKLLVTVFKQFQNFRISFPRTKRTVRWAIAASEICNTPKVKRFNTNILFKTIKR
jgi:hypothetical protein